MSELLTVRELAERLKLSRHSIREMVREGRLPYLKIGRSTRFEPDVVMDHFKQTSNHPVNAQA